MPKQKIRFALYATLYGLAAVAWAEPQSSKTAVRRHVAPQPAISGPVGEMNPLNRKREPGTDRRPALLNLNDELRALDQLNKDLKQLGTGETINAFVKGDSQAAKPEEFFFKQFLVVDNKIVLFGEDLKGVLTCRKGGGNLLLSQGRQINTQSITPDPEARSFEFQDADLCRSAFTVLKADPKGDTRLIVVEADSQKITRFDVR